MRQIGKGVEYIKSIPSILKIAEFIILLIAIGIVGYFLIKAQDITNFFSVFGKKGNLQFFLFATVFECILVMALFTSFLTGLHEKISQINWQLAVAIIFAVCAVLLLIALALVADTVNHYNSTLKVCKALDDNKLDPRCGHLIGGAVCGFIAMVLFAVDAAIHVRMFLNRGISAAG